MKTGLASPAARRGTIHHRALPGALLMMFSCCPVLAADHARPTLSISPLAKASTVHIRARHVPLAQLLSHLAQKTRLNLHHSIIPAGLPVSGDCTGSLLPDVLECLVGVRLNMMVRFSGQGQPIEAWLLDGNLGDKATTGASEADVLVSERDDDWVESDDVLVQAQSKNPQQRMEAIGNMASTELSNPALAKQLLNEALDDANPEIRAKAIGSLAGVDGGSAKPQIMQLLADDNVSVRLAAVVAGYNDPDVLLQAQNDPDEQVRALAESSLNRLMTGSSAR